VNNIEGLEVFLVPKIARSIVIFVRRQRIIKLLVWKNVVDFFEPIEGWVVGAGCESVEIGNHVVSLDKGVKKVYQVQKSLLKEILKYTFFKIK
jgi:hypothetical protein